MATGKDSAQLDCRPMADLTCTAKSAGDLEPAHYYHAAAYVHANSPSTPLSSARSLQIPDAAHPSIVPSPSSSSSAKAYREKAPSDDNPVAKLFQSIRIYALEFHNCIFLSSQYSADNGVITPW
ncbi:hypothetical protein A0H81_02785 [Grifola frondosa]|uniref:Uncharacterized protein n=1 Tax=Grifola frondosa TaxID=5627 RepID=A0A1C7MLB0_GRIFR|nr:hypothetical protein A0H81_02785 [Grifola frondosa]